MKQNDLILVIDMQNVYTKNQAWACLDTEGIAKRIVALTERTTSQTVMLTEYLPAENPTGTWRDYNSVYADINGNAWLNELVPDMQQLAKRYPLYCKSTYSSMSIPFIREQARKADRVVLTGVVAECCVLYTALEAMDMGCKVIYLKDCVSGFTKEKEAATELILSGLSPLYVLIMTKEAYLNEGLS
ncbi:MAG: isochorismatase family protein [Treponema sp.]|nr:isochorismatase family protein [Treponema sp.]